MNSNSHWSSQNRVMEIARQRKLHHDAARLYYSSANPEFDSLCLGSTQSELDEQLESSLAELDAAYSLLLLTVIEALFRRDFNERCKAKLKDPLSRGFRALKKAQKSSIKFSDDILERWKNQVPGLSQLISDLRSALGYRDWLAHGRYWNPKLGRRYDFPTIHDLAERVLRDFDLRP